MEQTLIDVKNALKVIENNKNNKYEESNFTDYTPCYNFSNENLNEYYNNQIGEKILTVCGSGDQALAAILFGATTIDCFDSNNLTYYTMMLKLYLIKYTTYQNFLEFYDLIEPKKQKIEIYKEIRQYIDKENIKLFWDEIFKNTKDIEYIYKKNEENKKNLFIGIPYLKKENFEILKQNIPNSKITFKQIDIFDIPERFKEKYDFINLSNIFTYIEGMGNTLKFCKLILTIRQNNIKENGKIMINYSWNKMHQEENIEIAQAIMEAYKIDARQKNITAPAEDETNSILYCTGKRN